jgi:hypothetical protein
MDVLQKSLEESKKRGSAPRGEHEEEKPKKTTRRKTSAA